jgi:DNA modification methylase
VIVCDDVLSWLREQPDNSITLAFADPPDNIGLEYNGYKDQVPEGEYYRYLELVILEALRVSHCFFISYYHKHDLEIKSMVRRVLKNYRPSVAWKQIIWRFTFGQHQEGDYGNGYRPILRLSKPTAKWNVSEQRVRSARQDLGDVRANPEGRVPDDVWEYPRVVGNAKERRAWHVTQHPEGLLERVILSHSDPSDIVADLYAGSGTCSIVADRLGRKWVAIESDPFYCSKIGSLLL